MAEFVDSIRPHVESMVVSHRPEHKMSVLFTMKRITEDHARRQQNIRPHSQAGFVPGGTSLGTIVDPAVRRAVQEKFAALGGELKQCEVSNDWPALVTSDNHRLPIRSVRTRKVLDVSAVGHGSRERFVMPANNHHVEVFAKLDRRGKEIRWESNVVSLLEAAERARKGEPVVARAYADAEEFVFKFSLMGGDVVEIDRAAIIRLDDASPRFIGFALSQQTGSYR